MLHFRETELEPRAIFSIDASERGLLGAADELTEFEPQSRSQSIRDFNSHIHFAKFNRTDICAVDIGAFCEVLLGEGKSLSRQTDRPAEG
jgi:hypothetical protein